MEGRKIRVVRYAAWSGYERLFFVVIEGRLKGNGFDDLTSAFYGSEPGRCCNETSS
jgi:hypothetical protein